MDGHSAYEFTGLGAMDGHSPYEFTGLGAMDGHSPYEYGATDNDTGAPTNSDE